MKAEILKLKYNKLLEEKNKLKAQNTILKAFYEPTAKDKLQAIEDYIKWCAKKEFEPMALDTYLEYKEELLKWEKYKNEQ